jgi:hypothetical protein
MRITLTRTSPDKAALLSLILALGTNSLGFLALFFIRDGHIVWMLAAIVGGLNGIKGIKSKYKPYRICAIVGIVLNVLNFGAAIAMSFFVYGRFLK